MKPVYKCRLCGARFSDNSHTGKDIAMRCTYELAAGLVCTIPGAPYKTICHHCVGKYEGSLGMADFQGFEIEEDDKE